MINVVLCNVMNILVPVSSQRIWLCISGLAFDECLRDEQVDNYDEKDNNYDDTLHT